MSTTTTNMGLKVPQIGDPSPGYVSDFASTINTVDAHDHSAGNGVKITQAGLNISGALPMNQQTLSGARSVLFSPQPILGAAADNGSLFVNGVDLYYLDGNNTLVRLTTGGKIGGGIGGDYPNYPLAQLSYSNPDLTYYFRDGANNFAKINPLSVSLGTSSATSGNVSYDGTNTFSFKTQANVGAKIIVGAVDVGVGNIVTTGNITTSTGTLSGSSGSITNTLTANNLSATSGVTAASMTATGTIQAATLTATGTPGTVNANNVISSNGVQAATATISGNAAVGSLNAVGGVLQGSRIIALRGLVKGATLSGTSSSFPIQAYVDGSTASFVQTTFTSPYAGSIAALTCRAYGAAGTGGSIILATSGLTTNAVTSSFNFNTVTSGAAQTFTPGTYTFAVGTAFTVNIQTTSWVQSTTGTTGVEVTMWVYC